MDDHLKFWKEVWPRQQARIDTMLAEANKNAMMVMARYAATSQVISIVQPEIEKQINNQIEAIRRRK